MHSRSSHFFMFMKHFSTSVPPTPWKSRSLGVKNQISIHQYAGKPQYSHSIHYSSLIPYFQPVGVLQYVHHSLHNPRWLFRWIIRHQGWSGPVQLTHPTTVAYQRTRWDIQRLLPTWGPGETSKDCLPTWDQVRHPTTVAYQRTRWDIQRLFTYQRPGETSNDCCLPETRWDIQRLFPYQRTSWHIQRPFAYLRPGETSNDCCLPETRWDIRLLPTWDQVRHPTTVAYLRPGETSNDCLPTRGPVGTSNDRLPTWGPGETSNDCCLPEDEVTHPTTVAYLRTRKETPPGRESMR